MEWNTLQLSAPDFVQQFINLEVKYGKVHGFVANHDSGIV